MTRDQSAVEVVVAAWRGGDEERDRPALVEGLDIRAASLRDGRKAAGEGAGEEAQRRFWNSQTRAVTGCTTGTPRSSSSSLMICRVRQPEPSM